MEETMFDNDYFRNKVLHLRQRLHGMDGFMSVEKISENVPEREETEKVAFVKSNEKVNS